MTNPAIITLLQTPELPYRRGGALVVLDEQFDGF